MFENQTINEPIINNGKLTLINCVMNGDITGTGDLKTRGNNTLKNVTQTNIEFGWWFKSNLYLFIIFMDYFSK